jgi:hypothetical protein
MVGSRSFTSLPSGHGRAGNWNHPDLAVGNALYDLGELAEIIARDVLT